jgi:hypothetical protein
MTTRGQKKAVKVRGGSAVMQFDISEGLPEL